MKNTVFPEASCSPEDNCREVTGTHTPVFSITAVFKILLGRIPQQTILVTYSALHNTSHAFQQFSHQASAILWQ